MFVKTLGAALLIFTIAAGENAPAGSPRVVSSPGIAMGVESHAGFAIAPAPDVPTRFYTEDLSPVQVFEIIRPDMAPFSAGRILASCACLEVSLDKKDFGSGERALVQVRNVKPTQPNGAVYAFFVEIVQPFRQTLQYDVFVKSETKK